MTTPPPLSGRDVLATPMDGDNDAGAYSIREYLIALLAGLWAAGSNFSGKYALGNSDWQFQIFEALIVAGHIRGSVDEHGYIYNVDQAEGRVLISRAIEVLKSGSDDGGYRARLLATVDKSLADLEVQERQRVGTAEPVLDVDTLDYVRRRLRLEMVVLGSREAREHNQQVADEAMSRPPAPDEREKLQAIHDRFVVKALRAELVTQMQPLFDEAISTVGQYKTTYAVDMVGKCIEIVRGESAASGTSPAEAVIHARNLLGLTAKDHAVEAVPAELVDYAAGAPSTEEWRPQVEAILERALPVAYALAAKHILFVADVLQGVRCPACHGVPASRRFPAYRCGCGHAWTIDRDEWRHPSRAPGALLAQVARTGELPTPPNKIGDM